MTNLGRCSDASCTELAGRLFECAHHCKKMVCLHHLIEHDRCVEQHHHELENLSGELRQLWTAYQSSIDEVKLRSEFEHRVKRHRQLLGDVSNLLANENVNHEQCRLVLEKLKQNIEQVKDLRRSPLDTTPPVEKVKMEPIEDMSMVSEFGSFDESFASGTERSMNEFEDPHTELMHDDSPLSSEYEYQSDSIDDHSADEDNRPPRARRQWRRKLLGECPLSFDGAFGLSIASHGTYLCQGNKVHQNLACHLLKCHKLTRKASAIVCRSIENKDDPASTILFQPSDAVLDQVNQFLCPFSVHHRQSSTIDKSSERPCRATKPQFAHCLRYHLLQTHQMSAAKANQLVVQLKIHSSQIREELAAEKSH